MKANLSKFLFFFLGIISIVAINSCKRNEDCGEPEKTRYLEKDDLTKLVYKGNERLTFIDSSTNTTYVFKGMGYVTDFGTAYTQDNCAIKYNLERKYLGFQSPTFSDPLFISLYYPSGIDGVAYVVVEFGHSTFSISANSIRNPYAYDSISVQDKIYYNIADLNGCYYNLTQGILKMDTWDGHVWELLKIDTL